VQARPLPFPHANTEGMVASFGAEAKGWSYGDGEVDPHGDGTERKFDHPVTPLQGGNSEQSGYSGYTDAFDDSGYTDAFDDVLSPGE
jgi:hypothetical protein